MPHQYFVYILVNSRNTVLYTGVTSELARRVWKHREKQTSGFTSRYDVEKLVYYEVFVDVAVAFAREKRIKAGSRAKKIVSIDGMNPGWPDLYPEIL